MFGKRVEKQIDLITRRGDLYTLTDAYPDEAKEQLQKFIHHYDTVLVFYLWTQCGHCEKLRPSLQNIAEQIFKVTQGHTKILEYVSSDVSAKNHVLNWADVTVFPTIRLYEYDKSMVGGAGGCKEKDFAAENVPRTVSNFITFVQKHQTTY